jgi:hypothetical protein
MTQQSSILTPLIATMLLSTISSTVLAQDITVKELISELSDTEGNVRADAAAELRKLLASDKGARTNNHGRLYWQNRVDQVKPGTTDDEVKRLLPSTDTHIMESWSGGTGNRLWRLDDYWTVVVHYYYPDRMHEMRPSLHGRARIVEAKRPTNLTGTWITYYVNGQKAHELN